MRYTFENKIIKGLYATQYVASWYKACGPSKGVHFTDWLRQLVIDEERLSDDEIRYINSVRTTGKLELEANARLYKEKIEKV